MSFTYREKINVLSCFSCFIHIYLYIRCLLDNIILENSRYESLGTDSWIGNLNLNVCMYIHCFKDNMVKTFIGKLLQKIFKGNLKIRVTFVGKMLSIKSDFQLL